MRRMKFVWIAIAVAGLHLASRLAAAMTTMTGAGGDSLDLTIGDSVPLSGALADFGPGGDKAAQIASSEINNAIKQAGVDHKVTLVTEDNETSRSLRSRPPARWSTRTARAASPARGHRGHDPDLRVGHVPRGRAADLARLDQQRGRYAR